MLFKPVPLPALLKGGLLGVVLASLPPQPVSAQKNVLRAEYFSIDDGLSDRLINDIHQDDEGFIWISTPNGLNRFDGYNFLAFNNHPDNEYAISSTNVERLARDEFGKLVIFYQNNKLFFDILDPRTNDLTKVRLYPEDGVKGFVRTIHVNRHGQIYLTSIHEDGTHVYRCRPGQSPHLELLFRIPEVHSSVSPAIDMAQLDDGSFLINDGELGLRLFSVNGALLKSFELEDFDCLDYGNRYPAPANFLHQDQQGAVWLSLTQVPGAFRYNAGQQRFEQVSGLASDGSYTHIWEDQTGNILLAQSEPMGTYFELIQLQCVRPDGNIFDFTYLTNISPRIQTVFAEDFFKTVFLGIDTGLSIVQNNRPKIRTYLAKQLTEYMRGNIMRGIAGDSGGTVYFARENRNWYALDLKTDYLDTITPIDEATGRPVNFGNCLQIHFDSAGNNLWAISTTRFGQGQLHRYNLDDCTARTFSFPHRLSSFIPTRDGRFWLTCQPETEKGCLVSFDPATGKFTSFLDKDGKNPLRNSTPFYIVEGRQQLLWVGTDNGLYRIDSQRNDVAVYRLQPDEHSVSLSSNTIFVIHQDSTGRLWLGTNNGLNILDPATDSVRILDQRNGLAGNIVCGILPDEKGNYWISTYNGLSYYEPGRKQFRNFYADDGLSHDEFNRFSFFRDERGRYYFGGVNGINAFYSSDLLINDPPPPVVLTELTRYNSRKDALLAQCNPLCELEEEEVEISPYDIYFQFNFMLPNFSNPVKNQFSAWLEGYEKDWIYLGNTPNIRYSKLPAGRYTLHLKGADPNGNWSPPVSIRIRVRPIFYRTWWFILFTTLGAVGAIYGVHQYRLEQKLKGERLRTKLSSDLHDEVSGLLSGIAMQTDLIQELVADDISRTKLRTIGEKSRKAMSKMSDVIWSIDSRNDRVHDLLVRMNEHAEEMLAPLGIRFNFHISRLDRTVKMPVKIRQELYFIFKEAVNNIVKHSNASHVDFYLGNQGNQFEMTIHDNGSKIPPLNGKTGQGLSNIRMRAQRLDAQILFFNGQGYTVQLKMKKFA